MKMVIFGASGKTGKLLIDMALEAGHEVRAYVRRPLSVQPENKNLSVVVGALSDTEKIRIVVAGADACIGWKFAERTCHRVYAGYPEYRVSDGTGKCEQIYLHVEHWSWR